MKLSQLSLADYNKLDSIPVINQDLSASGFTPVANTYYRHTGATTDTFTQGVIYLYDTAYHKLGESGGTTLNRYIYRVDLTAPTEEIRTRILNIAKNAKKCFMYASCSVTLSDNTQDVLTGFLSFGDTFCQYGGVLGSPDVTASIWMSNNGTSITKVVNIIKNNAIATISNYNSLNLIISYYNYTEIT